jgi:hypothetical protein
MSKRICSRWVSDHKGVEHQFATCRRGFMSMLLITVGRLRESGRAALDR